MPSAAPEPAPEAHRTSDEAQDVDVHCQPFDRGILADPKMHESRAHAKQGLSGALSWSSAQGSSYRLGIKSIVLPSVSTDDYQAD